MNKIFLVFTLALSMASSGNAQLFNRGSVITDPNTATTTDTTGATPTVVPAATNSGSSSSGGASEQSANAAVGSLIGAGVGLGGVYAMQSLAHVSCGSGYGAALCAFAVVGAGAAGSMVANMLNTNSGANATHDAVTGGDGSTTDVTTPQAQAIKNQYQQALAATAADAAKGGLTINPDGSVTTADGQNLSAKDFASDQAMQAAGLSLDDISKIHAEADKLKKDTAKKIAALKDSGLEGGGGSGGSKSGSSASVPEPHYNLGAVKAKAAAVNRDPAQVAGMSKNFNGEAIGVANDSLFEMMKRRYQLHDQLGSFVQPQ